MTKVIFMGTPDFSVPVLQTIIKEGYDVIAVVTQPDRPVGRKRVLTPPPVKEEAIKHHIPVFQPEKLTGSKEMEQIIELEADVIITAAYGQLLPKALLESPRLGCINVHASLLPELRGGAPIHYAILQGKEKTGITIMYMAEKLDAGNIISQVEVKIEEADHVGTLHDKLSEAGSKLLAETLPKLIAGTADSIPQDEEQATFASNITREQEKIDWSNPGEFVFNQIRGLCPWPVAYTYLEKKVLKVWAAEKQSINEAYTAGEVIQIDEDGLLVATGNKTAIKIIELQPAGKKKMSAKQFFNGAGSHIKSGIILGNKDE